MGKCKIAIPDYDGPGLYEIRNLSNGKVYIGSSHNIMHRATTHKNFLSCGRHHCKAMQEDYNNGDNFSFGIVKKIHTDLKQELRFRELNEIRKRKKIGEKLYNTVIDFNSYTPEYLIMRKMADLWCMEKYGKSFNRYLCGNRAEIEMKYQILSNPDDENEIKAQFQDAIKYESKRMFYQSRYGIDYDEYLELPQEEKQNLKKTGQSAMTREILAHQ